MGRLREAIEGSEPDRPKELVVPRVLHDQLSNCCFHGLCTEWLLSLPAPDWSPTGSPPGRGIICSTSRCAPAARRPWRDRSIDQLAAGQEQMTCEITKLQAVEQYVLYKNSEPALRPAPAPMSKPFLRPSPAPVVR